jgi:hypothetical protein
MQQGQLNPEALGLLARRDACPDNHCATENDHFTPF